MQLPALSDPLLSSVLFKYKPACSARAKITSSTQRSESLKMCSDNTTPSFDDQLEQGGHLESEATDRFQSRCLDTSLTEISPLQIHIETEATDGFQSAGLDTTSTEISSLYIPTSERRYNAQVLVQDGLEWKQVGWDVGPTWSLEPCTDAVADVGTEALRCQNLISTRGLLNKPSLEFQGGMNKLYSITSNDASYLMRVTLPLDPTFKTWSEASTIALIRTKTTIPVPKVIAYSSSKENEIGFEWMLLERGVGTQTLEKVWFSLPWVAKTKLVEDVAGILGQLFNVRADAIGTIYQLDIASKKDKNASPFFIGRIVSKYFFWGDRIRLDHVHRGPFTCSKDLLHSRLQLMLHDRTTSLEDPDSSDAEKEDSLEGQTVIRRLLKLLPAIHLAEPERFALHHDDLSDQNILLDHTGALKVIVDWESTGTMPLFMCCQMPDLLQGRERLEKPDIAKYVPQGEEGSIYEEHLKDYELTLLREHFIEFMQAKYPAWAAVHHAGGVMAEFEYAVSTCEDTIFGLWDIRKWLDRVEGEYLQNCGKTSEELQGSTL